MPRLAGATAALIVLVFLWSCLDCGRRSHEPRGSTLSNRRASRERAPTPTSVRSRALAHRLSCCSSSGKPLPRRRCRRVRMHQIRRSPYYDWSALDNSVIAATSNGLDVVAVVTGSPAWALRPVSPGMTPTLPDPDAFADFGAAAAARYSGRFGGLPAVRCVGGLERAEHPPLPHAAVRRRQPVRARLVPATCSTASTTR